MGLQINTNIAAMNAYRNLSNTQNAMSTSLERLSSGLRINSAADDAAGLAISEKMRGQISGLNQASSNAQDGISLIQTAEGALNETQSMLQRMRQLAVQASNDTNSDTDRAAIGDEITKLTSALNDIASKTAFNGQKLLDGTFTGKQLQIGANTGDELSVSIGKMDASTLGISGSSSALAGNGAKSTAVDTTATAGSYNIDASGNVLDSNGFTVGAYDDSTSTVTFSDTAASKVTFNGSALSGGTGSFTVASAIDVTTQGNASTAIDTIDAAIGKVSAERASLGATQNTLQHTLNNLGVAAENASAAESRIRDTDMAKEMTSFTRSQILQQAGVSMLAQANSAPQSVLKLLG